jgi:hypothetical protein
MNSPRSPRSIPLLAASIIGIAFGLLTLKEGGTVLFGGEAARAAAGHYVPFVLWFNFLAGFAYIIAGIGLWLRQRRAAYAAIAIAAATAGVFLAFGVHILFGGAFEMRTVIAMTFRTGIWVAIAVIAWRALSRMPVLEPAP